MLVRDIPTSLSVARLAVKQREPSITPEVPELTARCTPQYALNVAKTAKYLLSLERADQYIVVIATAR
jgi:hypothetical protein